MFLLSVERPVTASLEQLKTYNSPCQMPNRLLFWHQGGWGRDSLKVKNTQVFLVELDMVA